MNIYQELLHEIELIPEEQIPQFVRYARQFRETIAASPVVAAAPANSNGTGTPITDGLFGIAPQADKDSAEDYIQYVEKKYS